MSKVTQKKYPVKKPEPIVSNPYNCEELLDALKSIKKVVQCYSCYKHLNSARMCLNGHGICTNCKNRCNKTCPVCYSPILETKPVMLNEIIKLLPRPCNFLTKGCSSMILSNDKDHETFCRFRHTSCRLHSCGWRGMAKDLLQHLERFHGREMIRTSSQTQILMSFNTRIDREGLAVIVAYNNIFWRHVRVRQNKLLQFFQYIPMEKPNKKYHVLISYHTPEDSYASTTPVHPDTFEPNELFKDKETFCLPPKIAISFSRFHSGVHHAFEIIQTNI